MFTGRTISVHKRKATNAASVYFLDSTTGTNDSEMGFLNHRNLTKILLLEKKGGDESPLIPSRISDKNRQPDPDEIKSFECFELVSHSTLSH